MKDVEGVELAVGDVVHFTSYDFGYLKRGVVKVVTEKLVQIEYIYYGDQLTTAVKKQSKFIVRTGSEEDYD